MKITPLLIAAMGLFTMVRVSAQQITIEYEIVDAADPETSYHLSGQSAYIQYFPTGFSTGGQMDGTNGPQNGVIEYTELFPPANLSDYLDFAYFGLMDTRSNEDGSIIDTSFVMALKGPLTPGLTFGDLFPDYTEETIVTALRDSFDSPEFFDFLFTQIPGTTGSRGAIGLPDLGWPGDVLDLVAFTGGVDGSGAVRIGSLATTVVIPEPASTTICALGLLATLRRRRSGN